MQDPSSIPTPLRTARTAIEIGEPRPTDPFRLFRVLAFFWRAMWFWWRTSALLLVRRKVDTRARAVELRTFLESMGGVWIKAAQLAALRRDVFLPATCDELSKLQDRVGGFPFAYAKACIEEELGGPLEMFFSEFSEVPLAAASIGQTHEARLRENGARVVVKVQRPFIMERFEQDLRYLSAVGSWLTRFGVGLTVRWDELIWELEHTLADELDYRVEAASARRMRKVLKKHKVYAPKIFPRYCTKRVLVMEYVEGVFMSDFINVAVEEPERVAAWAAQNNVDTKKVGERLLLSHSRQVFEDPIYHADLHPGNIILLKDSRFALIDFGSVGTMEKSQRVRYRMMHSAIAESDYAKAVDLFLLLTPPLPNTDVSALKTRILRSLRAWVSRTNIPNIPYHEKSLAAFTRSAMQIFKEFGVSSDWSFLRLTRSDMTLDASLAYLVPDLDYVDIVRRYEIQSHRRLRKASRRRDVAGTLTSMRSAIQQWTENGIFDGEWIRKRGLEFQGRVSKLAYLGRALLTATAWACVITAGFLVRVYVRGRAAQHVEFFYTGWFRETLDAIVAARPSDAAIACAILVFLLLRKLVKIRHYVESKEFTQPGRSV